MKRWRKQNTEPHQHRRSEGCKESVERISCAPLLTAIPNSSRRKLTLVSYFISPPSPNMTRAFPPASRYCFSTSSWNRTGQYGLQVQALLIDALRTGICPYQYDRSFHLNQVFDGGAREGNARTHGDNTQIPHRKDHGLHRIQTQKLLLYRAATLNTWIIWGCGWLASNIQRS